MSDRASGVLCHVSSLPSDFGIGDLGPQALRFADLLAEAGQKYWQVLPLNPTEPAMGHSPYSSPSAFAFNTLFISPESLLADGLLVKADLAALELPAGDRVDYTAVAARKNHMLDRAWEMYTRRRNGLRVFDQFNRQAGVWLDDYVLFVVLKRRFGDVCWVDWPAEYRDRHPAALEQVRRECADDILKIRFGQFLFYRQWMFLQARCSARGIALVGDMPIYVNYDSADVWSSPQFFKLGPDRRQQVVAGVPPDYFSEEGQRWGNPVYNWPALEAEGFSWWVWRLRHALDFFDKVRIDHFRAFVQYWEIPAGEKTARNGAWRDVPGEAFFSALRKEFPGLPIIAEDLGIITPDVDALKDRFGLPGMRVLMFAFHNDYLKSRDLPENYPCLSVVYTGTHDNNTLRGWYRTDITPLEKKNMAAYFGREIPAVEIGWVMIEAALRSRAETALIPLQDILGLGGEARMNTPSTLQGNWTWRLAPGALYAADFERLRNLTLVSGRG